MHRSTILIAPDSFKECLPSWEVAAAIARGWRAVRPDDEIIALPLADGGEGTVEAFVRATHGTRHTTAVTGPLGEPVEAVWGVLDDGETAIIEMAAASGLHLVPAERRDPLLTTTRGTGELIAAALDAGLRRIFVGLGGSATNDAGAGMAAALGYRLLDASGLPLPDGGAALNRLAMLDASAVHPALAQAALHALCDVDNPLLGMHGASAVYGPQKGAVPEVVLELDAALGHFADVVEAACGQSVRDTPGAGAAGGLDFGLMALTGARLSPGLDVLADTMGLDHHLARASLVITGEGRLDAQTASGKLCARLSKRAKAHGVPCVALVGALQGDLTPLYKDGLTAAYAITTGPMALGEAIAQAPAHLEAAGTTLARLWHAAGMDHARCL